MTAGEIFKDVDGKLRPGQEWALEVTDEAGSPLYSIRIEAKQNMWPDSKSGGTD